tara:strand:+ start:427 stop:897 length:471 start_codon:yes stop_codon:yes gene_type:complete
MKKLLFLFMLPALGFSQIFEEIITMTDVERFRKVMIENDYKRHSADSIRIVYADGLEKDSLGNYTAYRWGSYYIKTKSWRLKFSDGFTNYMAYEEIYKDVKENCDFSKILESTDSIEAVAYKCQEAKLQGLISFHKEDDGDGGYFIMHHNNPNINN